MNDIIGLCEKHGFSLKRSRKHLVFVHPSGAHLTTSKTASDNRALRNIERDIKRLLKSRD